MIVILVMIIIIIIIQKADVNIGGMPPPCLLNCRLSCLRRGTLGGRVSGNLMKNTESVSDILRWCNELKSRVKI